MGQQVLTQKDEQQQTESAAVISMIERVALDKDADIAKLEKMLDMQERILNRNAQQAFSADIAALQSDLPRVARNGKSHNGKYALLEDINDTVRPALQAHGFGVTFRVSQNGMEWVKITTILQHKQGHSEQTEIVLPLDKTGNKTATQSVGSTISYGKRYGICALLNISTGDDVDGGAPDQSKTAEAKPKAKPAPTSNGGGKTATEGQCKMLRVKLKQASKSETDLCAAFSSESIEAIPMGKVNDAIAWISQ